LFVLVMAGPGFGAEPPHRERPYLVDLATPTPTPRPAELPKFIDLTPPAPAPTPIPPHPWPHLLNLKPIPSQRLDRLTKDARREYELGMGALDKINYSLALDHFTKSVQAEPDNVYLRYVLVQLAQYLGDSRAGDQSNKYYDLCTQNLKEVVDSPKLNAREKERAQTALDLIASLRQSVGERDEKRAQYGLAMAKRYVRDSGLGKAKQKLSEKERLEKQAKIKALYQESMGLAPTPRLTSVTTRPSGGYLSNP